MKVRALAVLATMLKAGALGSVSAFQPSTTSIRLLSTAILRPSSFLGSTAGPSGSSSPCAMPNEVIPEGITALTLRSAVLTNVHGEKIRLDEKMGSGTSIEWCEFQQQQQNSPGSSGTTIAGPIFISIGDEEKLNLFLEKNPYVPRENALVDGYSFEAYNAAGFGRFDEVDKEVAKEAMKNMGVPQIGSSGAWNFMTSAGKLAPIPKDMKFGEIPEGVLRLGGTFVVSGNEITYRWSDRLPGDHPNIEQVYKIAENTSLKKSAFPLASVFGL